MSGKVCVFDRREKYRCSGKYPLLGHSHGKRHQKVDIYYNAIGLWCAPDPEEMEELFQHYWEKRQKLTA